MEKDCPSDPYSCLSFRSDAQASVKQELHLGNRGYTRLTDFHAFISLDQLWINNNKLTSLAGLESNFRLKILYAFQNRIHRLHKIIVCANFPGLRASVPFMQGLSTMQASKHWRSLQRQIRHGTMSFIWLFWKSSAIRSKPWVKKIFNTVSITPAC